MINQTGGDQGWDRNAHLLPYLKFLCSHWTRKFQRIPDTSTSSQLLTQASYMYLCVARATNYICNFVYIFLILKVFVWWWLWWWLAVYVCVVEVGHIFCAHDYALHSSGNYWKFYISNLNSLVSTSTWPGTKGKRKVLTRSEATVGEFVGVSWRHFRLGRLPVGVPGVPGITAIPPIHSLKRPYSLSDQGVERGWRHIRNLLH